MKIVILILTLVGGLSSAFGAERSYVNQPNLSRLIDVMAEIAADGASLEHFGYVEAMPKYPVKCSSNPVTSEKVAAEFSELAESIVGVGIETELRAAAHREILSLLGQGPYRLCTYSGSEHRSYTRVIAFIGLDYLFHLEIGYED